MNLAGHLKTPEGGGRGGRRRRRRRGMTVIEFSVVSFIGASRRFWPRRISCNRRPNNRNGRGKGGGRRR